MENNNKSGNNFFSGFLLGVLVGAGLVFLLGTKRGKKLLKMLSEKGLDNVSNILKDEDVTMDPDESYGDSEENTPKKEATAKDVERKPKVKRFFRGISRHLN